MDKKLQRQLLRFIKKMNNKKGPAYTMALDDIVDEFRDKRSYDYVAIMNNLRLLSDAGKIEARFTNQQVHPNGPLRVTHTGYQDLKPWPSRAWTFVTKDVARILSILATVLSIISILIQLNGN